MGKISICYNRSVGKLFLKIVRSKEETCVLILEAFSKVLHEEYGRGKATEEILQGWLSTILHHPPLEEDPVTRVIHTEIALLYVNDFMAFEGRSHTGEKLLDSLYDYCKSYENWQFSKWLHHIRASDFPMVQ